MQCSGSVSYKIAFKKLKKRIANEEIVLVKTDTSGKILVMEKEKYLSMGIKDNKTDKILSRAEVKKIEKRLNDHSRMICKILIAGESHGHMDRILNSKIVNSEATAPMYYSFKDHKEGEIGGQWYQVAHLIR